MPPSYLILAFVTLLIHLLNFVTCEEPQCTRSYLEERILERVLSIELKLQNTIEKMKLIEDNQQCKKKNEISLPTHISGVLYIDDIEADDWQMVFRATSGNGYNVYEAWTTGKGACDVKPVTMERSYACHYRNRAIADWSNLHIKYVKYGFFNADRQVAEVIFNGVDSDMINWFDRKRVVSSSWSDLTSAHAYNYFHMYGGNQERRFFINRAYNGCDGDYGHMVVIDTGTPKGGCDWEKHPVYPQFLYSQSNSADYWDKRFGKADYMTIFIKTA